MRMCFDDDDRSLMASYGLKESEVYAEAWHRASAQTYYDWWKGEVHDKPVSEERLAFTFIKNYHEFSSKLGC